MSKPKPPPPPTFAEADARYCAALQRRHDLKVRLAAAEAELRALERGMFAIVDRVARSSVPGPDRTAARLAWLFWWNVGTDGDSREFKHRAPPEWSTNDEG